MLTAALLAWLAGLRSWWFALAPPLVLYAFHNWDLFAVCATVVAFWALLRASRRDRRNRHAAGRSLCAAVALGVGAAFKIYPMMFALPIALWLGVRRLATGRWPVTAARRWLVAAAFAAGSAAVFVAINLPFMIAGLGGLVGVVPIPVEPADRPDDEHHLVLGFPAVQQFVQRRRPARPRIGWPPRRRSAALLLACALGWLRFGEGSGAYPWLPVCAAMVCGYLLFNKVHSPQFALWLLPFFVLLQIRPGWILAYFAADAAIGIGFFRWQYLIGSGAPSGAYDALSPQFVLIGVWGRAALLVALFVVFLRRRWSSMPPPMGRPVEVAQQPVDHDEVLGDEVGRPGP